MEYTNGVDGSAGGTIPFPGLDIGVHIFTFEATDACGNHDEVFIPVEVKDLMIPTPVCDEITDANLGQDGTVEVFAETFDDGSSDNCGICDFEVKRLSQSDLLFSPSVTFNCNDETVMVVMRVYDCFW